MFGTGSGYRAVISTEIESPRERHKGWGGGGASLTLGTPCNAHTLDTQPELPGVQGSLDTVGEI